MPNPHRLPAPDPVRRPVAGPAMPRPHRRFMAWLAGVVLGVPLAAIALNLAFDPLGYGVVLGLRSASNSERIDPGASLGSFPMKAAQRRDKAHNYAVYRPEVAIFGTSNVATYMDVGHPAVRARDGRPAFNYGLAGANIEELFVYFEHARHVHKPKRILVGLEFLMFNGNRATYSDSFDFPLAQNPDYWPRTVTEFLKRAVDPIELWGLVHAHIAPKLSPRRWLSHLSPLHPAHAAGPVGIVTQIAAIDAATRERVAAFDRFSIPALYPEFWKGYRYEDRKGVSRLDWLASLLHVAREQGIEVTLFVSPHHVRTAEFYRLFGWWPAYEQWLVDLAALVESHNAEAPGKRPVPLWNFCCYYGFNMDPWLTGPGRKQSFRWFADSYHFNTDLGRLLLDRMHGMSDPGRPPPSDLGERLTTATLPAIIAAMRAARADYAANNGVDIAAQAELVRALAPK